MNTLIENLNDWADSFLRFAWPMLWQSSLLIAIVFAVEYAFARRLRASIRYALWLVVLIKLVLPPAFALPTSAAWWLYQPQPVIQMPAAPQKYTVTYDNPMPQMETPPAPVAMPEPPKPKLDGPAWLLLLSGTLSFALLIVLLYRWTDVVRKIHSAADAGELSTGLDDAKKLAGLRSDVRLKIIDAEMSPAVCGLFHPVILLPRALAEKLTPGQLRAVLLHEVFHLRRCDVWVNCTQALLQIFYWWHPLLWVANARIRRVREEAVDDAVMLALRDEAETYAPTLLEVAKLALQRPLMSLGLVGIMESRSALRQRVERLMDFHAPRRAGLTFLSVLGIFAFSAVALPMGEAPEGTSPTIKIENEGAVIASLESGSSAPNNAYDPVFMTVNTVPATSQSSLEKTNPPTILIQAEIYRMRQVDFEKIISDPSFTGTKQDKTENFRQFNRLIKAAGFSPIQRPRILTMSGKPAQFYVGDKMNGTEFDCRPVITNGLINLEDHIALTFTKGIMTKTNELVTQFTLQNGGGQVLSIRQSSDVFGESNVVAITISTEIVTNMAHFQQRLNKIVKPAPGTPASASGMGDAQKTIIAKLHSIRLESFSSEHLSLDQVLGRLAVLSRSNDLEHVGINFAYIPTSEDSAQPKIDPLTGLPPATPPPAVTEMAVTNISVTVAAMHDATLGDVLDAVVKGATQPVHYEVHDFGIQFAPGKNQSLLFTRTFMVDTKTIIASFKKAGITFGEITNSNGQITDTPSGAMRSFLGTLGVDLNSPAGKAVFFNDRTGILLVRATEKDLDTVDKAIQALDYVPPQIHIKARFIEITRDKSSTNNPFDAYLGSFKLNYTNAATQPTAAGTTIGVGQPASVANMTGILTDPNFRIVLHALESRPGAENLGEPEVTTLSGRQTQMRVTQTLTVLTNFVFSEESSNRIGAITPQTEQVETGPILDVVPCLLSDGYTINLSLIPSVTEFLGYDHPPDVPNLVGTNNRVQLPVILPKFSTRQMVANLNVWDNQTVVLGGMMETRAVNVKGKIPVLSDIPGLSKLFHSEKVQTQEADLLVFITATVVDPAGNRVHKDDDMPFTQNGTPPQPQSQGTFPNHIPQSAVNVFTGQPSRSSGRPPQ